MSNSVDEMTERMLDDTKIGEGMRVLDIGCGPGAVALMLSRRVGSSGHVFAVDRDPKMLEIARGKSKEAGVSNITFIEGGFDVILPEHGAFDAVVGRRVLMYQSDAPKAVAQLARALRPGGVMAFHEHDMIEISDSHTSLPLHNQARGWLREMLQREGANIHMGLGLYSAFSSAGLAVERVRAEANVLTPTTSYPIAGIVRSVLPRLLEHGVATEADIDVDTLDERLATERKEAGATYLWEMVFCGWARKP